MATIRLLCLCFLGATLQAADLAPLPPSDRIHSTEEVKHFWLNVLRHQPLPPKSTGLHPEKQRARDREIARRSKLMKEIRAGAHDIDARLASLEHNLGAWKLKGNQEAAKETEEELRSLNEHLAKVAALNAQRELALKASAAIDQIEALEAEISALRQEIANSATSVACCD